MVAMLGAMLLAMLLLLRLLQLLLLWLLLLLLLLLLLILLLLLLLPLLPRPRPASYPRRQAFKSEVQCMASLRGYVLCCSRMDGVGVGVFSCVVVWCGAVKRGWWAHWGRSGWVGVGTLRVTFG